MCCCYKNKRRYVLMKHLTSQLVVCILSDDVMSFSLFYFSLMLSFLFGNYHFTLCRRENTKIHTKKIMLRFFFVLTWGHFYSIGSASTGSTKSATMELYTSSYNETMSGGGETLSSISEKSCISAANHNGQNGTFPTQAYLMVREKILYTYIFLLLFHFWKILVNAISPAWIE